jgi:hypothetical protein
VTDNTLEPVDFIGFFATVEALVGAVSNTAVE